MRDSLELIGPSRYVTKEIRDVTVHLLGDEDLAGRRRRLDPGGRVDDQPGSR